MPLLRKDSRQGRIARTALLLIDVINDLDFDLADELLVQARPMALRLAALKRKASGLEIPTIYVNDNFGQWKSDFRHTVEHCCAISSVGREISQRLRPADSDYFVLKPKHSGFYATTLDVLLEYLGVETLVITGIATNICVLFTANDAYMRDYKLFIPSDCVAANTIEESRYSLRQMKTILKADIRESVSIELTALKTGLSQSWRDAQPCCSCVSMRFGGLARAKALLPQLPKLFFTSFSVSSSGSSREILVSRISQFAAICCGVRAGCCFEERRFSRTRKHWHRKCSSCGKVSCAAVNRHF
jgi:nicotinamidase-related amidase